MFSFSIRDEYIFFKKPKIPKNKIHQVYDKLKQMTTDMICYQEQ